MNDSNQNKCFFIALLPSQEVQDVANQIKDHFAETYNSKAAKKSPPHVTLQPPFEWQWDNVSQLSQALTTFAKNHIPIPMTLDGFSAFKPRVIFINVVKTPELLRLQKDLSDYLETYLNIVHEVAQHRPFHPHLTVAFRDLKKSAFHSAWQEYQDQCLQFNFTVSHLTLLLHNGKQWDIYQEFAFHDLSLLSPS